MRRDAIERALSAAVGSPVQVKGEKSLGGGCINNAARLDTSAGPFFLKWNERPLPGLFAREATCLEVLRAAASSDLVVPKVVAFRDAEGDTPGFLIVELLEPGRRAADFDAQLGRGLAALHRTTADAFGFETDTYCGSITQPNPWTASWVEFYRDHRLGHQLRLATEAHRLSGSDVKLFERLLDRLPELLGTDEPPALIHGDLWSGNLHVAPDGRPALIDPASYFAHREAELGMMTLMGGCGARVYDAYDEAYPLAPSWRERNPLYELYHLVNHANLFGGGYVGSTMAVVRRFS